MNLLTASLFPPVLAAAAGIPENVLPVIYGGFLLGILGIGVAITAILSEARIQRTRYETIRIALEKGVNLPPDLLKGHVDRSRPGNDRRAAIVLLFLSPGLFVFLRMLGLGPIAYVSVITACIGLALWLNWLLDRKYPEKDHADGIR